MIVNTVKGNKVYLVAVDEMWNPVDDKGGVWKRAADMDRDKCAAFATEEDAILLNVKLLKRVCAGSAAVAAVCTMDEVHEYCKRANPAEQKIISGLGDADTARILSGPKPFVAEIGRLVAEEARRKQAEEAEAKRIAEEATEKPEEVVVDKPTTKRTPRGKLRPGGFEGIADGAKLLLTPKQVEFIERLSENDGWDDQGTGGEYMTDSYSDALSDTMSPMGVGAMITTLKEKGIITARYIKLPGRKTSAFKLTKLGVYLYDRISKGDI